LLLDGVGCSKCNVQIRMLKWIGNASPIYEMHGATVKMRYQI